MKRSKTSTFILELPLVVKPREKRHLLARMDAGRRLYNAVLGESLRRQRLMRESKGWQKARTLKDRGERSATFRKLTAEFGFTSASLSSFGTGCKNEAGWQDRLGAHETQKLSERAFASVDDYGFGKKGKPRFKGANRPLHSIESKSNATGIRWKKDISSVVWDNLYLPAMLAPEGKDDYQVEALSRDTKFCRILWRMEKGKRRWFVQLVQKGEPPVKHELADDTVALDLGPSTVAVFAPLVVALVLFCPRIKHPWKNIRRLQRALDRSRRATNPECFNPDGTWKKGKKQQLFSVRYKKIRSELAEAERILAAERKRSHGELANDILSHGKYVKTEKLSYRSFQKNFGRSVKVKAPGSFMKLLCRKAESAGGKVVELNTRTLKLSQYDHPTGTFEKKPLSQRWHVLGDGTGIIQRDTYSAFLAYCSEGNHHHPPRIFEVWEAQGPALRQSGWWRDQPASGEAKAFPPVYPAERVGCRRSPAIGHGPDVVAATREPGDPAGFDFGTPCL